MNAFSLNQSLERLGYVFEDYQYGAVKLNKFPALQRLAIFAATI